MGAWSDLPPPSPQVYTHSWSEGSDLIGHISRDFAAGTWIARIWEAVSGLEGRSCPSLGERRFHGSALEFAKAWVEVGIEMEVCKRQAWRL